MFSKPISHPLFKELYKGLFGYDGKLDILQYKNVDINIRGRSNDTLAFAVESIEDLNKHLTDHLDKATKEAHESYELMTEVVESGEYDLEADGGELPKVDQLAEVWQHMVLETLVIEPKEKYKIRLGFMCPWDIEHDFGIYVTNNEFQYCGISV